METSIDLMHEADGLDLYSTTTVSDVYSQLHASLDLLHFILGTSQSHTYTYIHDENQKIISKLLNLESSLFEDFSTLFDLQLGDSYNEQNNSQGIQPPLNYCSPALHSPSLYNTMLDLDPNHLSIPYIDESTSEGSLPMATSTNSQDVSAATSPSERSQADADPAPFKCPRSSKLFQKISEIGTVTTVEFAMEYTQSFNQTLPPNILYFNPVQNHSLTPGFAVQDHSAFLKTIPNLGRAIESNTMAEQHYRIGRRIALAHLFRAYELAQANPEPFLAWCKRRKVMQVAPRGNPKAMVSQYFSHLLVPTLQQSTTTTGNRTKVEKIQYWRKLGKPWAKLIAEFGYAILLLMPDTLTDEDLRVVRESDIDVIIQTIRGQQDTLNPLLATLNESLDTLLLRHE